MVKFLSPRAIAPAIAVIVLIVAAGLLNYDITLWNKACSEEVRSYDLWKAWHSIVGPLSLPVQAGALMALVAPALLVRSRRARNIITVLTCVLLVGVFACLSDVSWWDYVSNCYTGGHENAPGTGVAFSLALPAFLIAALNAVILAIDWIVWAIEATTRRVREVS